MVYFHYHELKKIKDSFVRTDETGGASAACLMTAIKYYGGTTTWEQVKEWCKSEPGHAAHALTEAARRAGFTVVPDLMDIERLKKHDIPTILYMYNDFDRMNYEIYGGSPILGVNAPVILGHGISSPLAIRNMLLQTKRMCELGLTQALRKLFADYVHESES